MLLVCTRVYSYVTRMYSYVTRTLLVCSFSHNRYEYQLSSILKLELINVMKGVAHCGYVMIAELIVCLTIVSQYDCGSRPFDCYTAGVHQVMVSTGYVSV